MTARPGFGVSAGLWLALALSPALAGCGQKGPLFLPNAGAAPAPAASAPTTRTTPPATPASPAGSPAAAR